MVTYTLRLSLEQYNNIGIKSVIVNVIVIFNDINDYELV